jgi:GNAT superfamily N-acetyltransferase
MGDTVAALRPRRATRENLPAVSQTLALSFYDDPVAMWCVPDGPRRQEFLPKFFAAVAESYLPYNEIYDVEESLSAAVWAPPDAADDERLGERIGEIAAEYQDRVFHVLGLLEDIHPNDSYYYLFFLGTRPGWQGRGIGSALMAPVLETCDWVSIPAYLEATSERNKALYLRHGFQVIDEIRLPDGPPLWPMWRRPR